MLTYLAQDQVFTANQLYPVIVIGILMLALSGAAGFVRSVTEIWDRTRRKPPAEITFATKDEVKTLETEARAHLLEFREHSENRWKENRDLIQEKVGGMEKWIGEKIADTRTSTGEQFGELRGELHALRGTMQALSNDLFRSVGRMEGTRQEKASAHGH